MKVNDLEISKLNGGGGLGATFLNYFAKAIETVYSIGQEFGGSIRRIATRNTCPL